jgi:2-polyprenyl-3-methyl-5-hydroxy-6-metoxy-1,4-benzoquinol methylase
MTEKFKLQNNQYNFPYHHIPYFREDGTPALMRFLGWGMDYLCYMKHIRDMVTELKPASILDVGCGDGYFLRSLDSLPAYKLGVDLSKEAIRFAQAFHSEEIYRCMDAAALDEQFDVVTAIEVLEHVPDDTVASFVQTLYDRTKPGGHLIVSVPSTVLPLQAKHYRHYDKALLDQHVHMGQGQWKTQEMISLFSGDDIFYTWFMRLTENRFWTLDSPFLNKLIWRRLWRRRITPNLGYHIVGTFCKIP